MSVIGATLGQSVLSSVSREDDKRALVRVLGDNYYLATESYNG